MVLTSIATQLATSAKHFVLLGFRSIGKLLTGSVTQPQRDLKRQPQKQTMMFGGLFDALLTCQTVEPRVAQSLQ